MSSESGALRTLRSLPAWELVLAVGLLLSGALLGLHGINKLLLGDSVVFSIDGEASVGTWYSAMNFFAAATVALISAAVDPERRRYWLLAGLLFLAFSVDDIVGLHEATETASQDTSRLLLQPFVAAIGCGILIRLGMRLAGAARLLTWSTAALLALGSFHRSSTATSIRLMSRSCS